MIIELIEDGDGVNVFMGKPVKGKILKYITLYFDKKLSIEEFTNRLKEAEKKLSEN